MINHSVFVLMKAEIKMKEYTIARITMLDADTFSAVLIDSQGRQNPVEIQKTTQNILFARFDTSNMVYVLHSETGEGLSSIKEYDSVFLDDPIPLDQEIR